MAFPKTGTVPKAIPQVDLQAKHQASRGSIVTALFHGSTKLTQAKIELRWETKIRLHCLPLSHFSCLNTDLYHCAYSVRSCSGKMLFRVVWFWFFFFVP